MSGVSWLIWNPLDFHLPEGIAAWCHICPGEGKGFKTIDECQEHIRQVHRVWKG